MPAEKQIEAVSKKLVELNPGFDGKFSGRDGKGVPKIENGVVTELWFRSNNVTDISPVRALAGLKVLQWMGEMNADVQNAHPISLSPLQGMHLETLACVHIPVSDLSPISEMSLTSLKVGHSLVSDLSPLRNMPLSELECGQTEVSDLSPLKGMKLTSFNCGQTKVSTLSPLQGMPLTTLHVAYTQVSDLTPLQGMPLTTLNLSYTQVSSLSPLQGMKLTSLELGSLLKVTDLSPLKGMQLTRLSIFSHRASDLSPLTGMPLTFLSLRNTPVSDLSPLREMPLTSLECGAWRVSDLTPLEDIKSLKTLDLKGQKSATSAAVAALQKALPNCKIDWDDPAKPTTTQPEASSKLFMHDPAFPAWMKDVQAMPAEQQIEAVSKKLVELNPGFDGVLRANDKSANQRLKTAW